MVQVVSANAEARAVLVDHGLHYLDLEFWLRNKLQLRANDGVHWSVPRTRTRHLDSWQCNDTVTEDYNLLTGHRDTEDYNLHTGHRDTEDYNLHTGHRDTEDYNLHTGHRDTEDYNLHIGHRGL
ncbi:hypothetical protein ACOMHN_048229 [Nucella lapillus]